uniref:Alternative protein ADAMTS10 n=1 Tax=Homo sapiens TaxID=9606 RepID=L0R574_HUMAN|nr:alternative protein ADAMTS10 [Homo sapiens]
MHLSSSWCWPGPSCLPSATASMPPSPVTRCPPTPGTMRPGPSARPSVQAVARCRRWSAATSWTAPRSPPTTAVPTASCPKGSAPATRSLALQTGL